MTLIDYLVMCNHSRIHRCRIQHVMLPFCWWRRGHCFQLQIFICCSKNSGKPWFIAFYSHCTGWNDDEPSNFAVPHVRPNPHLDIWKLNILIMAWCCSVGEMNVVVSGSNVLSLLLEDILDHCILFAGNWHVLKFWVTWIMRLLIELCWPNLPCSVQAFAGTKAYIISYNKTSDESWHGCDTLILYFFSENKGLWT